MTIVRKNLYPYVSYRHVEHGKAWNGTFDHTLISLTFSGGCTYRFPEGEARIQTGDLLYFAPLAGQDWIVDNPTGWEVSWVIVESPLEIKDCLAQETLSHGVTRSRLTGDAFDEAQRAYAIMKDWYGKTGSMRARIIQNQAAYILLLSHANESQSHMEPRVAQAFSFLQGRMAMPTTLADVCEATHLSKARLCALFKQEAGMSPLQYLESLRLEEAARRLRFTDDPIEQIALSLAYSERNYFDKRFKRYWKTSPGVYRQQARNLQS